MSHRIRNELLTDAKKIKDDIERAGYINGVLDAFNLVQRESQDGIKVPEERAER